MVYNTFFSIIIKMKHNKNADVKSYQVKIRHSNVDIKIKTWLNIADCVRWMALCRSFWNNTEKHILNCSGFPVHLAWAASCRSCYNYHVKFSHMFRKWRKMFTTGRWKQEIKILTRDVPRTIKQLMKGLYFLRPLWIGMWA